MSLLAALVVVVLVAEGAFSIVLLWRAWRR
jgi:hypothetical protein